MADYPITNVARRIVYTGSAGVGPYAFSFPVLTSTDIAVYKNTTLLTLTTDYTVSISGTTGEGSVTLVVAATGSDRITIVGARAIQRSTDFVTGGDFFANTLNTELDSEVIFVQQVAETAERSLKAPVTDPTSINMTLPNNTTRAGKYLSFNASTGNPEVVNSVTDVTTVAGIAANITTVAGISADVTSVAGNSTNINTVAGISANVTTVAGISSNVTTVAANSANVTTVANDLNEPVSEINTVAVNISDVNAVGTNIASVNTAATNIAAIIAAPTEASNAAASAILANDWATKTSGAVAGGEYSAKYHANAASTSASNASTSASNAASAQAAAESARDATLTAYDNFDDRYLGAKSSAPSVDNDGNALVGGALYFDTVAQGMYVYTGTAWTAAYISGAGYLAAANNLSELTNTANARTNLGLAIGTNVQAYDAELAALAGLTSAADKGIQFTGSGTASTYDLTTAGKALLDDIDAAAQRTTLGLGTIATAAAPSGAVVGTSDSQTLTNKTIDASSNTLSNVSLTTAVTGTLPVANGGTGASTLTANNVMIGNGTSAVTFVAPGTSGNILTSDGTTWTSATPAGGGGWIQTVFNSTGTWTKASNATGAPTTARVIIQVIGGGGGGTSGSGTGHGGGGGGYFERTMRLADVDSSVTATVGGGGGANAQGGTSSFGSYASVSGGQAGNGGRNPGLPFGVFTGPAAAGAVTGIWGGYGGTGGSNNNPGPGQRAVYGGGGGSGGSYPGYSAASGASFILGGSGGQGHWNTPATAGVAPGGGGGGNVNSSAAAGAAGTVIITVSW